MVGHNNWEKKKLFAIVPKELNRKKKDKLNERSRKKSSVGGAILFSFFFRRFGSFFSVDSIIRLLFFFFVLIQSFTFPSFFVSSQSFDFPSFFVDSIIQRTVSSLFVFLLCGHKFNWERGKKKTSKCQKLLKTFRIKKVPIKRNVFNDVMGWLSSVCNNMLYLTTQVVKRARHLYWVLLNDCFWQHF